MAVNSQYYGAYQQGLLDEGIDPSAGLYGTAATGLLFAPGAGLTDMAGYAPDPMQPGAYLPSFTENIGEGQYLDAGLQLLGGAGDVMMAGGTVFPPLAAAGAVMKAPRAARVAAYTDPVSGAKITPEDIALRPEPLPDVVATLPILKDDLPFLVFKPLSSTPISGGLACSSLGGGPTT